jgi:predicted DNA-binding ArsR family transcriptional regulator
MNIISKQVWNPTVSKWIICTFIFMQIGISSDATILDTLNKKPRLLVLTDIGGDPDDTQSLRRLLVYANEFQIEGIIATATRGKKPYKNYNTYYTFDSIIYAAINDYEKVHKNLLLHKEDYPSADELRKVVKEGETNRGAKNLSPGKSTPGSLQIIEAVDESD